MNAMQPLSGKPSALVKPTLETKYHIDYSWWDKNTEEDLRTYILSHLLPEQREKLGQTTESVVVDFIDPTTGEVREVNELGLAVQIASQDSNFINQQTSLIDSVFRVFLANGNQPLSSNELGERTGRPAATILKTIGGTRVYKGIRPYQS
jgi:hypothetical protein